METMPYEACRAKTTSDNKPGITVLEHCRQVARVAEALAGMAHPAVRTIIGDNPAIAAAVHDTGKASPGFQKKYFNDHLREQWPTLAAMPNYFETDHTVIGAAAVRRYLKAQSSVPPLSDIVGAHHGRGHKTIPRTDEGGKYGGKPWAEERQKLIDRLVEEFGPFPAEQPGPAARNVLAGLVTVADWIGSDEARFPPEGLPPDADLAELAAQAVRDCGFQLPAIRPGLSFEAVFGFPPHPVQETFIECVDGPGLYVLEAPMGLGKTEAALYAAYRLMAGGHNRGLYFGLPTRLTSDKIHERVTAFLKTVCEDDATAQLAHGHAWLRAFGHGGEAISPGGDWFSPRKRKLLFPFGVGTIDQALMGVVRVKHFFIRTFALAGKVVILDEVHSYDVYTGSLMERLVRQLLEIGCTVIVLSATLTGRRRTRLFSESAQPPESQHYPLISHEKAGVAGVLPGEAPADRTFQIRMMDLTDAEVAAMAVERAAAGQCVLCIADTVARAQAWYNAVAQEATDGGFPIGLIHSRFPAFRRDELETHWIGRLGKNGDRPGGCVLIGTQVLEQSLDIDADFFITELAPMDMILQRMGREWRHPRSNRPCTMPETVIVSGDPEGAADAEEIIDALGRSNCYVYMPYVLWRTRRVLLGRDAIRLPGDIRDLLEATYAEAMADEPEPVVRLREMLEARRERLRQFAQANRSDVKAMGVLEDQEGVCTRYSDRPTIDALLVSALDSTGSQARLEPIDGEGAVELHEFRRDLGITARLHRNLVSVPAWHFQKIGGVQKPKWLNRHFFDPVAVLVRDPVTGELTLDGKETGLTYDAIRGLMRPTVQTGRGGPLAPDDEHDDRDFFDITQHQW